MLYKKRLPLLFIIFCFFFFAFTKNTFAGSLYNLSWSRSSQNVSASGVNYCFSYRLTNGISAGYWAFTASGMPWITDGGTYTITQNGFPTEWIERTYYMGGNSLNIILQGESSFSAGDTIQVCAYNVSNTSIPGLHNAQIRTTQSSGATVDSVDFEIYNVGAQLISTQNATSVGHTSALLHGYLSNIGYPGSITEHGFVWSTSPNPTTSNNKINLGALANPNNFSSTLSDLNYLTTYYVKAYSISSQYGTVYGDQISFTTTIPTYSITYNANNATSGSIPDSQTKTQDININLATNARALARTGYTYLGWNTSADGTGTDYSVDQLYSTNAALTLYAKWQRHTYSIAFDGNTSSSGTMANQNYNYDIAQNITSNGYLKTGYTFSGWNTVANGTGTSYTNGQNISNISAINNDTVTFYAQWTANTYEIAFNETRATSGAMTNQTFTYDAAQNLKANTLVRPGFLFREWNTALNRSGTSYANTASILNLTPTQGGVINLYAHWWEIKSSVSNPQPVLATPPSTTPPTTVPAATITTTPPATTKPGEVATKKTENQILEESKETLISETKSEQEQQQNVLATELYKTQIAKLKKPIMYGGNNKSDDIKLLEQFLKYCEGYNIVIDGVYSKEDRNEVIKWQEKYQNDILSPWGITEGTGHVYIKSLQKIKELSEKCVITDQHIDNPIALNNKFVFTRDLFVTSTGEDVRNLQSYLNSKGFYLIDSGEGSIGKETNYFGELTKKALSNFQKAKNINPTDGYFGPITRKIVNEN